jgi:hypothetical protein
MAIAIIQVKGEYKFKISFIYKNETGMHNNYSVWLKELILSFKDLSIKRKLFNKRVG